MPLPRKERAGVEVSSSSLDEVCVGFEGRESTRAQRETGAFRKSSGLSLCDVPACVDLGPGNTEAEPLSVWTALSLRADIDIN